MIVEVTPKEVTALPRQNVSFLCRVAVPLQYCRIEIPGVAILNLRNNVQGDGVRNDVFFLRE